MAKKKATTFEVKAIEQLTVQTTYLVECSTKESAEQACKNGEVPIVKNSIVPVEGPSAWKSTVSVTKVS